MATASRRIRLLAPLVAAVATAALLSASAMSAAAGAPSARSCYGAAARAEPQLCRGVKPDRSSYPLPADAQITPNSPCVFVHAVVNLCTFGTPPALAAATIALVGDSHAWHWRAAVDVVAHSMRWHAFESSRSSCSLTAGFPTFAGPKLEECLLWKQSLIQWFAERPDISVVFTSDHPQRVRTVPGQSQLEAQVAGVIGAWEALPATVRHIVVIRDIPYVHEDTLECVERAIHRHKPPASACKVRRRLALHSDPDAVAAQRLRSPRVQLIDLTRLLCDARFCYPVIGGVLAYRDADHLTRAFAATVGPYLLAELRALMAGWS